MKQKHFSHFLITTEIEHTPLSSAYLAVSASQADQKVYLKVYPQSFFADQIEQQRLLQTAETIKNLRHPHFVPVLEVGKEEEQVYIASEYISGGSLRVHLDRAYPQTLPFQQAMTIIEQIGQALATLHAMQIVHGQLKPDYILLAPNDQALLAHAYAGGNSTLRQDEKERVGIERYRAPEQATRSADALSDQYSLCCIAYELLTGQAPFTDIADPALKQGERPTGPQPLRSRLPALPIEVDTAIMRGLAHDPAQRHADILSLLSLLRPFLSSTPRLELPLPRSKRTPAPPARRASEPVKTFQSSPELPIAAIAHPLDSVGSTPDRLPMQVSLSTPDSHPMQAPLSKPDSLPMQAPTNAPDATPKASPPDGGQDDDAAFEALLADLSHQEELFLAGTQSRYPQHGSSQSAQEVEAVSVVRASAISQSKPTLKTLSATTTRTPTSPKQKVAEKAETPAPRFSLRAPSSQSAVRSPGTRGSMGRLTSTLSSLRLSRSFRPGWTQSSTARPLLWIATLLLLVGSLTAYIVLASVPQNPTAFHPGSGTTGVASTPVKSGTPKSAPTPTSTPQSAPTPAPTAQPSPHPTPVPTTPPSPQPKPQPQPQPTPTPGSRPSPRPTPAPPAPTVTFFKIVNRFSGKALDDTNWSTSNGTAIQQWTPASNQTNQEWKLVSTGDGYYYIVNRFSGKVLDDTNWSTSDGTTIQQWTQRDGQTNQEWKLTSAGSGYYYIVNRFSGKALDDTNWSTSDGTTIQQWTPASNQTNQEWHLITV